MDLSVPAEDCLLSIHRCAERQESATTSGLARALGVADSTVTVMIQKLARLRLVSYKPRREIALTKQGSSVAAHLIRKHRLIETFLHEQLGYSWDEVHAEAERIEHVVSERFIEALDRKLNFPQTDPHGDPIPDSAGHTFERTLIPLRELRLGEQGIVRRVCEKSSEALVYLAELEIKPQATIVIKAAPAYDDVLEISVNGRPRALGKALAAQVLVERSETLTAGGKGRRKPQ